MVGIIAISHGLLAKALIKSIEMVYGKLEKVEAICLEQGEGMDALKNKIDITIKQLEVDEILIFVDLLGGTPYNASSIGIENSNINIITGLNMPMILEILPHREVGLDKLAYIAVEAGKNGIVNVKERFQNLNRLKDIAEDELSAKDS